MGNLMTICSIKHSELAQHLQKYKGRVVYRGDNAKDEHGALAIYQELAAHPTTIQTANASIAYGCLPGHSTTQSDAVRAYVQSPLRSKYPAWVHIPREFWPDEWHAKGYSRPMCKLEKALYGHPEGGVHWERFLTK